LVFSHEHNTFDKRKLLDNQHHDYFKVSNRTVDEFIRCKKEDSIKQFFMKDIDDMLKVYTPGEPSMKPDVLLQIKQIEEERKKIIEEQQTSGVPQMMINEEGKQPRPISPNEIVQLMNQQMEQMKQLTQKNQSLEAMVANLQKKISQNVKNEPVEKKSEKIESDASEKKSVFTDILLARINELEKIVNSLKNTLDNDTSNIIDVQTVSDMNKLQQNIRPMIKSKTIPEVKVNIR
jgi:hypothetical protein